MPSATHLAYHVDLYGILHASYELRATEDEQAKIEAGYLLKFHSSIEVWNGSRWIARLVRSEPATIKRH